MGENIRLVSGPRTRGAQPQASDALGLAGGFGLPTPVLLGTRVLSGPGRAPWGAEGSGEADAPRSSLQSATTGSR